MPGCHFFTTMAPVPAGAAPKELAGLAALALEEESPFSEEQLAAGHYAVPPGAGLVVFAAVRRKFAAQQEAWARAGFVVPDFATWLPRAEAGAGVVVLETREAVTALEFGAGSALPRKILSRPVAAGLDSETAIERARELALARLGAEGRRVHRYRLAETPCTVKGGRYRFNWEPQGPTPAKSGDHGFLTAAQLWAMDLRETEFLRGKRRDFQWNRRAWGALVGLGIAACVLVVAEFGLLGVRLFDAARQKRVEAQAPAARQSETNRDIVERLAGYIDRKPQPLELLAYVNDLRPRSIYFTKVSFEGGLQMIVEGATSALAEVNEFESALRRAPAIGVVEVKNTRAREGGGTFQLTLAFKPGFQPGAVAAAAPGVTPVSSAPAVTAIPAAPPSLPAGPSAAHAPRMPLPASIGNRDLQDSGGPVPLPVLDSSGPMPVPGAPGAVNHGPMPPSP